VANKKISELTDGGLLASGDSLPIVRGGDNQKAEAVDISTYQNKANSLAELKDLMPTTGALVFVAYETTADDGWGGFFRWVDGAVATDYLDSINVNSTASGAPVGHWTRVTDQIGIPLLAVGDNAEDDTSALQAALDRGVLIIPEWMICRISDELIVKKSGTYIEIRGEIRRDSSAASFIDAKAMFRMEREGDATTGILSDIIFINSGVINCNLNTTTGVGINYGLNVVFARFTSIRVGKIIGARENAAIIGNHATLKSYQVNTHDGEPILHEVQTGTPWTNANQTSVSGYTVANSIGLYYKNCSDSSATDVSPIGYQTGCRNDDASIVFTRIHPWIRAAYHGVMPKAFHLNYACRATDCYADSPVDGASECYGFYISAQGCVIENPKVFLNSDHSVDGTCIAVYSTHSYQVVNDLISTTSGGLKFKSFFGGAGQFNSTMTLARGADKTISNGIEFDINRVVGRDFHVIQEDFLGVGVNSSLWATISGTSGASAAISEIDGGGLLLTSGNNASGADADNGIQVSGGLIFKPSSGAIRIVFMDVSNNNNTNLITNIGIVDQRAAMQAAMTISGGTATAAAGADAACFIVDAAATAPTTWKCCTAKDGVAGTPTDTGVATSSGTPRTMEIRVGTTGDVEFYLNDVKRGSTLTAALDPSLTYCVQMFLSAKANVTRTSTIQSVYVYQET